LAGSYIRSRQKLRPSRNNQSPIREQARMANQSQNLSLSQP
jgi:hypothetical protein